MISSILSYNKYIMVLINQTTGYNNVLKAVSRKGHLLQYASPTWKANKDIVLAAVRRNPSAIKYASIDLRDDTDVIKAVYSQNSDLIKYASDRIQTALNYLKESSDLWLIGRYNPFPNITDIKFSNKAVVLETVSHYGDSLQFASAELRADKEVVLAAVSRNGDSLQFASAELRADREFIIKLVSIRANTLHYASEALKSDRSFALSAVSKKGACFNYLHPTLTNDKSFRALCNRFRHVNRTNLHLIESTALQLSDNLFDLVIPNLDLPLLLQDLSGDEYQVFKWCESNNLITTISELYPSLGLFDIYINDKLISEVDLNEVKRDLLTMEEGLHGMIVYLS